MIKQAGFTLIEILLFIVVVSLVASTVMLSMSTSLRQGGSVLQNTIANQTAKRCMDWFIGQRQLLGYTTFSCPSTAVPSFCSSPSGYSLAVNITCTTINSDANYKTIAVTVSGNGDASLTSMVANY